MLRVNSVTVTYPGGTTALRSVSTIFNAGQFAVLLGPSGSGKSTLLRCLNGMIPCSAGKVTTDDLGDLSEGRILRRHRRRTAMVFQQHQLIGRQTALRNVLVGRLGYHSTLRSLFPFPVNETAIAMESLERVGLLHKAMDRVDNLSGGEQQRVGIARALAQRPQIILADEPIASLDPAAAHGILSLLHEICKEDGLSAVVSLHQVEMARKFADRIVGLTRGRIVFDGSSGQLAEDILSAIYHTEPASADVSNPGSTTKAAFRNIVAAEF